MAINKSERPFGQNKFPYYEYLWYLTTHIATSFIYVKLHSNVLVCIFGMFGSS